MVMMVTALVMVLFLVVPTSSLLLRPQQQQLRGPLRRPPLLSPLPQSLPPLCARSPAAANNVEDGVSLATLTDPDRDGSFLNAAVVQWLDREYIVQDVHRVIGAAVEASYTRSRRGGATDLGEVMMNVGTALEGVNMREAFVNAWDVANKVHVFVGSWGRGGGHGLTLDVDALTLLCVHGQVSDLLMARLDRELCACSGDVALDMDTALTVPLRISSRQVHTTARPFSYLVPRLSFSHLPCTTRDVQRVFKPIAAVRVPAPALAEAAARLRTEFAR